MMTLSTRTSSGPTRSRPCRGRRCRDSFAGRCSSRSRRFRMFVARLVDVELAAAGQRHFGEHTPALILHRSAVDPVLLHLGKESADVVAHEKERVAGALRLVHRDFSRRQAKDYVAAVIDAGQLEHVAEESEVSLGLRAADDAMRADEHRSSSFRYVCHPRGVDTVNRLDDLPFINVGRVTNTLEPGLPRASARTLAPRAQLSLAHAWRCLQFLHGCAPLSPALQLERSEPVVVS